MIRLTRYDNKELFVNAELILFVESKPDTILTLTTGEKIIVKESQEEVVDRIVSYKQTIHQTPFTKRGQ
jgi:flagellar protein FlbD